MCRMISILSLGCLLSLSLVVPTPAATLTWEAPPTAVQQYKIYRSSSISTPFILVSSVDGKSLTFIDTAGVEGNCWRVTAVTAAGESQPTNNGCLPSVTVTLGILLVKP